jgi:hypothetical protein
VARFRRPASVWTGFPSRGAALVKQPVTTPSPACWPVFLNPGGVLCPDRGTARPALLSGGFMETLLLIVLGIAGLLLMGAALYAAGRQTAAGCRWIAMHCRTLRAWWQQRRPPPPPALTMPLTRWDEHDIPTWRRRGQIPPALIRSAPPPELTAPLPDWTAQERPTWQRRGQPFPTLAPLSAATQPPLAQTLPSGKVIF